MAEINKEELVITPQDIDHLKVWVEANRLIVERAA